MSIYREKVETAGIEPASPICRGHVRCFSCVPRVLRGLATPHGDEFPQQVFNDKLYEIYFRFLETEDEYFDYAPAKVPPQGRWRIYGINLPDSILGKVYYENSARLLQI